MISLSRNYLKVLYTDIKTTYVDMEVLTCYKHFQVVNLGCNESSTFVLGVRGGYALEVCLARWWSSLVDGQVEIDVEFHSLRPSHEEVM